MPRRPVDRRLRQGRRGLPAVGRPHERILSRAREAGRRQAMSPSSRANEGFANVCHATHVDGRATLRSMIVYCDSRLAHGALAQVSTDIIRGRVTDPDAHPVAGVEVKATSYSGTGHENRDDRQERPLHDRLHQWRGRLLARFHESSASRSKRYEIKKIGDEEVMIADARLSSADRRSSTRSNVVGATRSRIAQSQREGSRRRRRRSPAHEQRRWRLIRREISRRWPPASPAFN